MAGNFLFLGLGASATGFLLWNLATKWIGAVKTSVYIYVSPVVTVVLSVFVLHEKMTVVSVLGSVLIFVGLVVSQKRPEETRSSFLLLLCSGPDIILPFVFADNIINSGTFKF